MQKKHKIVSIYKFDRHQNYKMLIPIFFGGSY